MTNGVTLKCCVEMDWVADIGIGEHVYRCSACERQVRFITESALTSPPAPSGWQPIESAPKDGRWLLLQCGIGAVPQVGNWFKFSASSEGFWQSHAISLRPTHWMPLPPAPGQNAHVEAPSGWQQRIAAMDPVHVPYGCHTRRDGERFCIFCGAVLVFDPTHKPDCLWQNAKDALPPSSSDGKIDQIAERLVEEISGYLRSPHSNAGRVLTHVRKAISDAIPPSSSTWVPDPERPRTLVKTTPPEAAVRVTGLSGIAGAIRVAEDAVERLRGESALPPVSRVVDCPECHRVCEWCAWFAKNAREAGCGAQSKRKCEWGESLKGSVCGLCGGAEKVRLVGNYEPLVSR